MYPERSDRAPVVMVIHPGAVLDDWTRAIADRLAADGYIAIAPDLASDDQSRSRKQALDAVRGYARKIPAANGKVAVLGFEQGGKTGLEYAMTGTALNAAIAISAGTPPIDRSYAGGVPVISMSHDFMSDAAGANEAASHQAWARVLDFLARHVQ